jgi:hypothetical protein
MGNLGCLSASRADGGTEQVACICVASTQLAIFRRLGRHIMIFALISRNCLENDYIHLSFDIQKSVTNSSPRGCKSFPSSNDSFQSEGAQDVYVTLFASQPCRSSFKSPDQVLFVGSFN